MRRRATGRPLEGTCIGSQQEPDANVMRIMIVPMCEYLGGTGSGAQFQVLAFGAFYVESINSQNKPYSLTGRFIEYHIPGAGGDALAPETGLWTTKLVQ